MGAGLTRVGLAGSGAAFDLTPYFPVLLYIAVGLELFGGLAIIGGGYSCGTVMLMALLAAITYPMHYVLGPDGKLGQMDQIMILKNASLFGAALLIFVMSRKIRYLQNKLQKEKKN